MLCSPGQLKPQLIGCIEAAKDSPTLAWNTFVVTCFLVNKCGSVLNVIRNGKGWERGCSELLKLILTQGGF